MIQVYTGDGKGKTTAAFGQAMRAAGHGLKVRVIQFMKGSTYTGELSAAERLGMEVWQFGRTCPHAALIKNGFMTCQQCGQCFIGREEISELDRMKIRLGWDMARRSAGEDFIFMLVLDEIMAALHRELVEMPELLELMDHYPADRELVLTGRGAPAAVMQRAGLVTEMKLLRHPYTAGCAARRGIEY